MSTAVLRVLIVEDSENDAELLLRELRRAGYELAHARIETAEAMNAALDGREWDVVIADYTLPQFNAIEALGLVQAKRLDIPFLIVSGSIGEDRAVTAMKAGAHDYLMKGNIARLVPAIERELKEAELRREYRRAQERIQYLAYYDALTDLPNRTLFTDRLTQAVLTARREKRCFALIFMDLDGFKDVNDTRGHAGGDRVLRQVAARLQACLRESDTVGRIGGDEFAILLPAVTHANGANTIARKVLGSLAAPFRIDNRDFEIGASLGIALFPEHGMDADLLMRAADNAMYEAKQTRCGCKTFNPDTDRNTKPS